MSMKGKLRPLARRPTLCGGGGWAGGSGQIQMLESF